MFYVLYFMSSFVCSLIYQRCSHFDHVILLTIEVDILFHLKLTIYNADDAKTNIRLLF